MPFRAFPLPSPSSISCMVHRAPPSLPFPSAFSADLHRFRKKMCLTSKAIRIFAGPQNLLGVHRRQAHIFNCRFLFSPPILLRIVENNTRTTFFFFRPSWQIRGTCHASPHPLPFVSQQWEGRKLGGGREKRTPRNYSRKSKSRLNRRPTAAASYNNFPPFPTPQPPSRYREYYTPRRILLSVNYYHSRPTGESRLNL